MKIVLSRDVKNVGRVGDICVVKNGYGRNFLIPKGYAVVANKGNVAKLQEQIEALKKQNEELSVIAGKIANLLGEKVFNIVRQASDDGIIYGSVRNRDVRSLIGELVHENRLVFSIDVGSIKIETPIKSLGRYVLSINLFGDTNATIRLNVCRTATEFDNDVATFDKKYAEFLQGGEKNKEKVVAEAKEAVEANAEAGNKVEDNKVEDGENNAEAKKEEITEKKTKAVAKKTAKKAEESDKVE